MPFDPTKPVRTRCGFEEGEASSSGMTCDLRTGDALTLLRQMPDKSVDCCVTSPPYWGLRNYGVDGQYGLEPTPEEWVARQAATLPYRFAPAPSRRRRGLARCL
jgi:hypothetical protein